LKKIIITLLVCTSSLLAKAQLGYNYAQYDLGFAGALNRAYTDAETVTNTPGAFISFTYNQTPYLNFIAEAQAGQLKGGDVFNTLSSRYFNNHYKAVSFRVQLQAGELFDYSQSRVFNALKNFYGSTGLGVVYNSMHEINRTSLYIEDFTATGVNTSSEVFIPVKVGYEFKIFNSYNEPTVKFDLGYQANFDLGDQLDGMKAGSRRDIFTQFTIGFKFALGGYTSYRKQIQY
jgi:hypothetical protein